MTVGYSEKPSPCQVQACVDGMNKVIFGKLILGPYHNLKICCQEEAGSQVKVRGRVKYLDPDSGTTPIYFYNILPYLAAKVFI